MRPVAFFDVDRTLIDGYTGFETSLSLIRTGVIKRRRVLQALFYRLASKLYLADVLKMYEIAVVDMAGETLERMRALGREIFDHSFAHRVFAEGVAQVRAHQAWGHEVVLLSSGPYMTVDVLHHRLRTDHCYSMGPAVDPEGILLPEIRRPICVDHRKREVAMAHAEERGIPLSACYFYTDSIRDLALLEAVGHRHVVNPDRKLERIAGARGWPIHRWLHHAPRGWDQVA